MADNIKGITIQIGGDVQPLNQALAEAARNATAYGKKLGEINQKLKLDPKNVELLTEKHNLLTEAIATNKEQLAGVREAIANTLNGKFGKATEEQLDALRRMEANLVTEGENLNVELENTNRTMASLGEESDDAGDSMEDMSEDAAGASENVKKVGEAAEDASISLGDVAKLATLFGAIATGAAKLIDSGKMGEVAKQIGITLPDAYTELKESIDETHKSTGKLLDQIKQSKRDTQTQSQLIGIQATEVEKLNKQLQEEIQNGQTNTTTRQRLKQQVDLLNTSLGEEVIQLNEENGLISTNGNYWQQKVEQTKAYVLMQADLENMQNLWVQEAQIQADLDAVNEKIANGERGIGTSLEYKRHQLELDLAAVQEQTRNAEENYQKQADAYTELGDTEVQVNSYVLQQMEERRKKQADIQKQIYDDQVNYNKKRVNDATETEKKIKANTDISLADRIQNMRDNQKAIEDYETNIQKLIDHANSIQDEHERQRWLKAIQSLQERNADTMGIAQQMVEGLDEQGEKGAQAYVDAFNDGIKEGHMDRVFVDAFGKIVTMATQYGNRLKKALTITFDVKTGQTSTSRGNIKVTAFAQGGIVTKPTNALVGEAGPEAIIPLDRLGDVIRSALASNRPTGGNYTMNVYPRDMTGAQQDALLNKFNRMLGGMTPRESI
mgnify:CR=1 FL=1